VAGAEVFVLPDEELISLMDLWRALMRYKWMILGVTLAAVLAGGAAALLMTPTYRAEVVLTPVGEHEGMGRHAAQLQRFGAIAALAGVDLSQHGSKKNEAIATLRSRVLTEQFIRDEKLLPVLFHERWDEGDGRWDVRDPDDIPTLWDAYKLFDEDVRRISDDSRTGMVVLTIDWEDPQLAAEWGNELVRRTNALLRDRTEEESQKAIDYLRAELNQTSAMELQQVLNRLIESEMKEIILAKVNEEFAFRVIDPATPPEEAFSPRPVQMAVIAGVLGLIASVILALLRNFAGREQPAAGKRASEPAAEE
jgi:uncharacterized protein involved in exopolysaccharide biosynthesis